MKQPHKSTPAAANQLAPKPPQTPRERRDAQREEFNKRFEAQKKARK